MVRSDPFPPLARHLDKRSGTPLYLQLSRELEAQLEKQVLRAGDRLPGNVELARLLNVNVSTVSKAMAQLVDKGLIVRRRRAGTFVTEHANAQHGSVGFYYLREREPASFMELEAIQRTLSARQLDVKLIPFDWDFFQQVDVCEDVRRRDLRGAIFTILPDAACREAMQSLEQAGFPHVRLGNRYFQDELHAPLVAGDDERLVEQTFRYLQEHEHMRVGCLGGAADVPIFRMYRQLAAAKGEYRDAWRLSLNFDGPLTIHADRFASEPVPQLVRGYLHENPELTAVLVWHPLVAQQLVEQAEAMGRGVPERLSVICLRDGAAYGIPTPCSAWSLSRHRMGELAAETLLRVIDGDPDASDAYVRWKFIDRGSVAGAFEHQAHMSV